METHLGSDFKEKDKKIKAIMGMCQEHAAWIIHQSFLHNRIEFTYLPCTFRSNPKGGLVFTRTPLGLLRCLLAVREEQYTYTSRTVFLSTPAFDKTVYRWNVQVEYGDFGDFYFGVAFGNDDGSVGYDSYPLGDGAGSCCFFFRKQKAETPTNSSPGSSTPTDPAPTDPAPTSYANGSTSDRPLLTSMLRGILSTDTFYAETPVPDGAVVGMEIDQVPNTLSFFVNEKKVPRAFLNIESSLHLGMTIQGAGTVQPAFTCLCYRRLARPTASAVHCTYYEVGFMCGGED